MAARVWLPEGGRPAPAVLEYIPYRQGDGTALGDSLRHPYFAANGYASVRVDLRGSGDSEGLLRGEYLRQEQDDALEVIAWIAAQPWCTGAVGMIGYSWGGFAGLQIAARRPPALKAVISLHSTDDRYADDCHYVGGALLADDMIGWASTMLAYNALPPDPSLTPNWRALWQQRLDQQTPWLSEWLRHQRRDAFWQHGSVCEDYAAITCPVLLVGGWADAYTNSIPRLLAGLRAPCRAIIGPWAHQYPHEAVPGPAIGFLQEACRWWDHWLRGDDRGVLADPPLRVYLQDSQPPATYYAHWPGEWLGVAGVMPAVTAAFAPPADAAVRSPHTLGHTAGKWCPYGSPGGEMPDDQAADDAVSVCFESAPATAPEAILGYPEVQLRLSADRAHGNLIARLCDVGPDGASLLVSWGVLNLTHRHSHLSPEPLTPGAWVDLTLTLNVCGHRLSPGHHWRLGLSTDYFPHVWPPAEPVTLALDRDHCQVRLPVLAAEAQQPLARPWLPPESAPPMAHTVNRPFRRSRRHFIEPETGAAVIDDDWDSGAVTLADGRVYGQWIHDVSRILPTDPLSAELTSARDVVVGSDAWRARVATHSRLRATATHFLVDNTVRAFENDQLVFERSWQEEIARDFC